jgi:photosynthetic reaction center cytochrome c subunit
MNDPIRAISLAAAACLLAACERPPVESVQSGFRGTGMVQVSNPRIVGPRLAAIEVPAPAPAVPATGQPASAVYKNVQVLGDVDAGAFIRLMTSLTQWVSPQQGCVYCHKEGEDMAADTLPAKRIARQMLAMTRTINGQWKAHVGETGVTCYTCHRGQPVPAAYWVSAGQPEVKRAGAGWRYGQNAPAPAAAWASLPEDPFTPYLERAGTIRVLGKTALPADGGASIQHTEWTYALMMHMSDALGVNCTFCHNSRSFAEWEQSSPQRVTAWHGIRMLQTINSKYIAPLAPLYPKESLGPTGDAPKANCATCHQGLNKPLAGAQMVKHYPELIGPAAAAAAKTALLGKILFAVGKSELAPEAQTIVASVVKTLQEAPALKVALSGFADASGNREQNLELAKQRAMAVRDALLAAGVGADRVVLQKPEFVIGGLQDDARRVDVRAL